MDRFISLVFPAIYYTISTSLYFKNFPACHVWSPTGRWTRIISNPFCRWFALQLHKSQFFMNHPFNPIQSHSTLSKHHSIPFNPIQSHSKHHSIPVKNSVTFPWSSAQGGAVQRQRSVLRVWWPSCPRSCRWCQGVSRNCRMMSEYRVHIYVFI